MVSRQIDVRYKNSQNVESRAEIRARRLTASVHRAIVAGVRMKRRNERLRLMLREGCTCRLARSSAFCPAEVIA
jgi:hypothetical protein